MKSHHITKSEIEMAKSACKGEKDSFHEHDDCIRIAFEWLDAQIPTENCCTKVAPLKHIIESWAGRYVSQCDVEVAAYLHPNFKGEYPHYNFSGRLVEPDVKRLEHIAEAFTQMNYREKHDASIYHAKE